MQEKWAASPCYIYYRLALCSYIASLILLIVVFQLFWYQITLPLVLYRISQAIGMLSLALCSIHYVKSNEPTDRKKRCGKMLLWMLVCYFVVFLFLNYFTGIWNKIEKLQIVSEARTGVELPKHIGMAGNQGEEDVLILRLPLLLTGDITSGYIYSDDGICNVEKAGLNCVDSTKKIRGNWYEADIIYCG